MLSYHSSRTWPPVTLIWSATVCKSLSRLAINATRYPRALENSLLQRLSLDTDHRRKCSRLTLQRHLCRWHFRLQLQQR